MVIVPSAALAFIDARATIIEKSAALREIAFCMKKLRETNNECLTLDAAIDKLLLASFKVRGVERIISRQS
jgi:hypothetical protein